jgi:hypothetical protein
MVMGGSQGMDFKVLAFWGKAAGAHAEHGPARARSARCEARPTMVGPRRGDFGIFETLKTQI